MTNDPKEAQEHTFEEIVGDAVGAQRLGIDDLKDVPLEVSADLGKCSMLVREVLELKRGSVIPLDKLAGEMTDIYVNDLPLARGEVVVIGDTLHVRLGEMTTGERTGEESDVE